MHFNSVFIVASLLPFLGSSVNAAYLNKTLPAAFFLAGDSTTHSGSGWGDGFVNKTVLSPAFAINYGVGGATLGSYRHSGYWATILKQVAKYNTSNEVFVTIQFGHNDQKTAANEAAFSDNLKQYVIDVKAAGGIPIVVTPLSRRIFANGKVVESLAVETAKALAVAAETNSRFIDLNKASEAYVNALGNSSHTYNLTPGDNTHLNAHGSVVFGRLVSDLLVAKYDDIKAWTLPDPVITDKINAGKLA